ncbi:hypothetical protein F511_10158 [Dorcoceras hygrometricum]|uniref:Uncharacterized protein n=1 Tax=Dorcoceras hygrometricum TaxID=472368 RepID=A0A2Z7DCK2_9LAMI|nr:hypothetical protein F511_10158 [Dorcoceras hygrometricum]
MGNSFAYVSATVGSRSIEKTVFLTSASSNMFRGNSDACVSAIFESLTIKKTVLLTSFHFIVFNGNRSAYKKAKGFAAQIGVLLKGMPTITMGDGVSFPSAKILSMKTVNTYISTNTTIDAREEQGMVGEATVKRTPKSKKNSSSADDTPVKVISEIAGSRKRVATEDNAPAIPKKRRTVKTKPSFSQASLDIVNVAQDVVPIQVIDPTPVVATITSPAPKQKSRKRRLVLSTGSDDETVGTQEIVKDADAVAVTSTDEADIIIAKVLEEILELGVSETERGGQGVDEAVFEEDFARWLDDFVARHSEPEYVDTRFDTRAEGSISLVVDKEMTKSVDREQVTEETMSIDDLLLQISDDLMLPSITAVELTKIRLGESLNFGDVQERDMYYASLPRISSHDKGKWILVEDEPVRGNPAREVVELICRDVDFLVQLREQRIYDSNCEILSKVNAVELGVRGDLLKLQVLLRQSLENACRVLERQGTTQATQINDLKKGLMAPVGTIFQDLFDIKKKQREQDAKLIALDGQIAAIRSEQLEFQTKIAADMLSFSTQVGGIADYIRGGDAKKGEIGSSSRPSTVRTQTFPPTIGTFAERAEQAWRHIIETGQVISIEEAAERVIEADRRESDRLERERERERIECRQSRSGTYKRRRGY